MLETVEESLVLLSQFHELLRDDHWSDQYSFAAIITLTISALRFPALDCWIFEIIELLELKLENGFIGEIVESWEIQALRIKCLRCLLRVGYFQKGEKNLLKVDQLMKHLDYGDIRARYQITSLVTESLLLFSPTLHNDTELNLSQALDFDLCLGHFLQTGLISHEKSTVTIEFIQFVHQSIQWFIKTVGSFVLTPMKYVATIKNFSFPRRKHELIESVIGYVATESSQYNMHNFAEALVTAKPIILLGHSGSGKSTIVREMANFTGNFDNLVTLHINDQTDAKSLIGGYVCTHIPGEFVWQNGIITKAVLSGSWLVIEDINKVNVEIISMLSLLLESRLLLLPRKSKPIKAHHNFRIIGTVSIPSHQTIRLLEEEGILKLFSVPVLSYLSKMRSFAELFYLVIFMPMSSLEILEIANALYSSIPLDIRKQLIGAVQAYSKSRSTSVHIHDIFKLLKRFQAYFIDKRLDNGYVTNQIKSQMLLDVIDIICGKIRDRDEACIEAKYLGSLFGFCEDEIDHMITHRLPTLEISQSRIDGHSHGENIRCTLVAGRTSISSVTLTTFLTGASNRFAQTNYAKRFLEKMAVSVGNREPILLVGETGGGKTTTVQELARLLGKQLLIQNLSLSSDLNDLLGGYRPVTVRHLFLPLYEQFVRLFQSTLSSSKNDEFLKICAHSFRNGKWLKLVKAFEKGCQSALNKLGQEVGAVQNIGDQLPEVLLQSKIKEWSEFKVAVKRFEINLSRIENGMAFVYQKGLLYEAMEKGRWILLDEINLAGPETLQILSSILDFKQDRVYTDFSDTTEGILIHPDFFLFAAMNPPTDICKKELPETLRNRFTEFYVEELLDPYDLRVVVAEYLKDVPEAPIMEIVHVYLGCRTAAESVLEDGAGQRARYSLRSLTRSLKSSLQYLKCGLRPFRRCLYEGFLLNFQCMLNENGRTYMQDYLRQSLFPDSKEKEMDHPPQRPGGRSSSAEEWTLIKPFWLKTGQEVQVDWSTVSASNSIGARSFIQTKSVMKHVRSIAAAVAANVGAILLQGPTSTGKTTLIQYIAARAGYKCLRINNHEHTDIQEYIGNYVTGQDGALVFQDGLLVQALRKGYWIILDELNLAPSDVLEALNRLLDDNKELLITETGEIVKPVEGFFLFATQNPPGLYGGRKPLSVAFRNRFVEINIPELPAKEIEEIISKSCNIAPKFSAMLVKVMLEMQKQRQNSTLFLGKHGGITVRDLVKWANRELHNAEDVMKHGFMLIAEKLRSKDESTAVYSILSQVCKSKWNPDEIYHLSEELNLAYETMKSGQLTVSGVPGFAITNSLKRMWNLLWHAIRHAEPVLLIGEAGCGKTMIVQLIAAFQKKNLKILNCHQSSETSDFIGGFRPVRGREGAAQKLESLIREMKILLAESKLELHCFSRHLSGEVVSKQLLEELPLILHTVPDEQHKRSIIATMTEMQAIHHKLSSVFEWQDGPVTESIKHGDILLIDEINLAEDAVIERINSVLEASRELTLAEKGAMETQKIIAHKDFRIIATMNPSGDFGKRELSPALRSRFTEIWIPSISEPKEILLIVQEVLSIPRYIDEVYSKMHNDDSAQLSTVIARDILEFIHWINHRIKEDLSGKLTITIREVLAWSQFVSEFSPTSVEQVFVGFVHGAFLTILDGLGLGLPIKRDLMGKIKAEAYYFLLDKCPDLYRESIQSSIDYLIFPELARTVFPKYEGNIFVLGKFNLFKGPLETRLDTNYTLESPTAILNLGRILRALQIARPILIEGAPGVGKSSLIANLALATGHKLVRINLSEHSEISDLLGSDLPISSDGPRSEHSSISKFKWFDGIFLTAMKDGAWVLLDELNLAPQSVLEGLNACFDHRKEVFLPEIGQQVHCAESFRVFCTQNPMIEGGGRKGLPESFLSRFTRVYVEALSETDMHETVSKVIRNQLLNSPDHPLLRFYTFEDFSKLLRQMVEFVSLVEQNTKAGSLGRNGGPWEFNLRDLFRWYEFISHIAQKQLSHLDSPYGSGKTFEITLVKQHAIHYSAYALFILRMRTLSDRVLVDDLFVSVFGENISTNGLDYYHYNEAQPLPLQSLTVNSIRTAPLDRYSTSFLNKETYRTIQIMGNALALAWPILLVGPPRSGKRRTVEFLAEKSKKQLKYFSVTSSLDASELIGSFEQFTVHHRLYQTITCLKQILETVISCWIGISQMKQAINEKLGDVLKKFYDVEAIVIDCASADQLRSLLVNEDLRASFRSLFSLLWEAIHSIHSFEAVAQWDLNLNESLAIAQSICDDVEELFDNYSEDEFRGRFVWNDGVIVEAATKGEWLILHNVNLATSSVLDRINGLLESHGSIVLTEEGHGREVFPHSDFRIILTMDPAYGEISRAMRNRCLEISFVKDFNPLDQSVTEWKISRKRYSLDLINIFFSSLLSPPHYQMPGITYQLLTSIISNPAQKLTPVQVERIVKKFSDVTSTLSVRFLDEVSNQFISAIKGDLQISNWRHVDSDFFNSLSLVLIPVKSCGTAVPTQIIIIIMLLYSLSSVSSQNHIFYEWIALIVKTFAESSLTSIGNYLDPVRRLNREKYFEIVQHLMHHFLSNYPRIDHEHASKEEILAYVLQYLCHFQETSKQPISQVTNSLLKLTVGTDLTIMENYQIMLNLEGERQLQSNDLLSFGRGRYFLQLHRLRLHYQKLISQNSADRNDEDYHLYAFIFFSINDEITERRKDVTTSFLAINRKIALLKQIWGFLDQIETDCGTRCANLHLSSVHSSNFLELREMIDHIRNLYFTFTAAAINDSLWNEMLIYFEWLGDLVLLMTEAFTSTEILLFASTLSNFQDEILKQSLGINCESFNRRKIAYYGISPRSPLPSFRSADCQERQILETHYSKLIEGNLLLWKSLTALRNIPDTISTEINLLDIELESNLSTPDFQLTNWYCTSEQSNLFKDFVAFYSTFYHEFSNEFNVSIAHSPRELSSPISKEDLMQVIVKLKDDFNSLHAKSQILPQALLEETLQSLSFSEKETYLCSDSQILKKIELELRAALLQHSICVMLNFISDKLRWIRNIIYVIVLVMMSSVTEIEIFQILEATNILQDLRAILNLYLSFTPFNPVYAREIQTMIWTLEYFQQSHLQPSSSDLLQCILRKSAIALDCLIYLIDKFDNSRNSSASYLTKTMKLSLNLSHSSCLNENKSSVNRFVHQLSSTRVTSLELLLHTVDLRCLISPFAVSDQYSRYVHLNPDSSATISLCAYSRRRIEFLLAFQSNLFICNDHKTTSSEEENCSTNGLARCIVSLIDVLNGCRKFFSETGRAMLKKLFSKTAERSNIQTALNNIVNLLADGSYLLFIEDSVVKQLFQKTIDPIVNELAHLKTGATTLQRLRKVRIEYCCGVIAALRLQLLIPDHLMDPILQPFYQARIVQSALSCKTGQITANLIVNAFDLTNDNLFSVSLLQEMDRFDYLQKQLIHYSQEIIHRPSSRYPQLMELLNTSFIEGAFSLEKVINYLKQLFESASNIEVKYYSAAQHQQLLDQAQIISSTTSSVVECFRKSFAAFEDITLPIISALEMLDSAISAQVSMLNLAFSSDTNDPQRDPIHEELSSILNIVYEYFIVRSNDQEDEFFQLIEQFVYRVDSLPLFYQSQDATSVSLKIDSSVELCLFILIYVVNCLVVNADSRETNFHNSHYPKRRRLSQLIVQCYGRKYLEYVQEKERIESESVSIFEANGTEDYWKNDVVESNAVRKLFPTFDFGDVGVLDPDENNENNENGIHSECPKSVNFPINIFDKEVMLNLVNIIGILVRTNYFQINRCSIYDYEAAINLRYISDLIFLKVFEDRLPIQSNTNNPQSPLILIAAEYNHLYRCAPTSFVNNHTKNSSALSVSQEEKDFFLLFRLHTFYGPKRQEITPFEKSYYPHSFHYDSSFNEVAGVILPLQNMQGRISMLLRSFPANEILLKIMKLIQQLLYTCSISTSIGKVLSGVESLLLSMQEWEMNAAKFVSLEKEMKEISYFIYTMRSAELNSWKYLLRSKEIEFMLERSIKKYYFPLMKIFMVDIDSDLDSIISSISLSSPSRPLSAFNPLRGRSFDLEINRGGWKTLEASAPSWMFFTEFSTTENESMEYEQIVLKYMMKLLTTFDTLLRSCTVGEFPSLLHTLLMMTGILDQELVGEERNIQQLAKQSSSRKSQKFKKLWEKHSIKQRILKLSVGVWRFYFSFLPFINKFQSLMQQPIKQKVSDEIKLGKWDALNVYALIENADKVHRKLAKLVREYQSEVLEFPIFSLISKEINKDLISDSGELISAVEIPSDNSLFPYLLSSPFLSHEPRLDSPKERHSFPELQEFLEKYNPTSFFQVAHNSIAQCQSQFSDLPTNVKQQIQKGFPDLCRFRSLGRKMLGYLKELLDFSSFSKDLGSTNAMQEGNPVMSCLNLNGTDRSTNYGLLVHYSLESAMLEIFLRLESLRQPSTTKPIKLRSIRDLLANLQEMGFSPLKSSVPGIFRNSALFSNEGGFNPQSQFQAILLQSSKVLPLSKTKDLLTRIDAFHVNTHYALLEKAESYYIRNFSEYSQLFTQSISVHTKELDSKEIQHMTTLSQNMILANTRLRMVVESACQEFEEFSACFSKILDYNEYFLKHKSSPSNDFISITKVDGCFFEQQQTMREVITSIIKIKEIARVAVEAQSFLEEHGNERDQSLLHDFDASSLKVFSTDELQSFLEFLEKSIADLVSLVNFTAPSQAEEQEGIVALLHRLRRSPYNVAILPDMTYLHSDINYSSKLSKIIECKEKTAQLLKELSYFRRIVEVFIDGKEFLSLKLLLQRACEFQGVPNQNSFETMDVSGEGTPVHALSDFDQDQAFLGGVNRILQDCLVIVQKLNSLRPSELSNSGNEQWHVGCFNEEIFLNSSVGIGSNETMNICQWISLLGNTFRAFQLSQLLVHIQDLCELLPSTFATNPLIERYDSWQQPVFLQLVPFISMIFVAYRVNVEQLLLSYKSMNKFAYINLRIFRNLLAKGICTNPAEDSEENTDLNSSDQNYQNMRFEEDEGTGMGEGDGNKDVSDEIQDVDQLMGLKDQKNLDNLYDKKPPPLEQEKKSKLSKEEQEKGLDTQEDFDGEMFDLEEEKEPSDGENESADEQSNPDREMGEANTEDIIDQKQWESEDEEGEDDDHEQKDQKEKMERNSKAKGKHLEEMTTTEESNEKDDTRGNDMSNTDDSGNHDKHDPEDDNSEAKESEEPSKVNNDEEENYIDKPRGVEPKEAPKQAQESEDIKEVGVEESDVSDGEGDGQKNNEKEEPLEGIDEGDTTKNESFDESEEAPEELPGDVEKESNDDLPNDMNIEEPDHEEMDCEVQSTVDENENNQEDRDEKDLEGKQDEKMDIDEIDETPNEFSITFGVQSSSGKENILQSSEVDPLKTPALKEEENKTSHSSQSLDQQTASARETGSTAYLQEREDQPFSSLESVPQKNEHQRENHSQRSYQEPSNPLLSKGNIEKEWFRRLNIVPNPDNHPGTEETHQNNEDESKNGSPTGFYEYDHNSSDYQESTQVLGKTNETENAVLQNLNQEKEILPLPTSEEGTNENVPENFEGHSSSDDNENGPTSLKRKNRNSSLEEADESKDQIAQRKKPKLSSEQQSSASNKGQNLEAEEFENNYDQPLMSKDLPTSDDSYSALQKSIVTKQSFIFGRKQISGLSSLEQAHLSEDLVAREESTLDEEVAPYYLRQWYHWRHITDIPSSQLSEALKLILEPTLLTKLQGYYRSGKKISMKKVISYISSNYRKDKIWLKRKKPNQRNYQMFVLVDNSKSMKYMANQTLETIVLLQQTFAKLEIGQLSIAKFGEELKILFPFTGSTIPSTMNASLAASTNALLMTDDHASKLLAQLSFDSERTELNNCLEQSFSYLVNVKESTQSIASAASSSGSMILQICFIISDARIDSENRQQLEKNLRRMAEEHILVILLIIDDPTNSSLSKTSPPPSSSLSSNAGGVAITNNNSILNTKVITFDENNHIITKSYFDDFPFPYYIIVQNVQQLPDVLADALKQWFELIKIQLSSTND